MTLSDGLELSLNSVYGKSNDDHSFLEASLYTMKTTLNGQLMLSMLIEKLVNTNPMQVLPVTFCTSKRLLGTTTPIPTLQPLLK